MKSSLKIKFKNALDIISTLISIGKSINNSSLNFIEKIGVLAVDNNGDC